MTMLSPAHAVEEKHDARLLTGTVAGIAIALVAVVSGMIYLVEAYQKAMAIIGAFTLGGFLFVACVFAVIGLGDHVEWRSRSR